MKFTDSDKIVHQKFTEYGLSAKEWLRKCALLLPEINRRLIWKKKGFSSIYEYAAKLAGMSRSSVEDVLRIMKKVEALPALIPIVEQKGLNRVRPLLTLVNTENQDFWAEKAKSMSRHTLATYVKNYRLESRTGPAVQPEKVTVSFEVAPELAKKLEVFKKRVDCEKLLGSLVEESQAFPLEQVPASSRAIPIAIKKAVLERTGGLCAYPSCEEMATSLHHTQRFALEKVHHPARLQPLCTAHERIAHLGLIENEEETPAHWTVRLRPDKNKPQFWIDQFVGLYRPT